MRGQSKKDNRSNCWTVKILLHENQLSALQAILRSSALEICVIYLQSSPTLSSLSCQTELGRESGKPQFYFLQFNYFLIHESDRNYGTIYKLAITWNAICIIGHISHIYSLRPTNSKTIKEVSVLSHQPCQWGSPGDHSQMCFHMTFILQIYFLAKNMLGKFIYLNVGGKHIKGDLIL